MQYLFFLIIPLLVLIPSSAAAEIGKNFDREYLGDNKFLWQSHYERIFNGLEWVNYEFTETPQEIKYEAAAGSFILNKNNCEVSFYDGGYITDPAIVAGFKATLLKDNAPTLRNCIINNITEGPDGIDLEITQGQLKTRYDLRGNGLEWFYNLENREGRSSVFQVKETWQQGSPDRIEEGRLYFGDYIMDTKNEQHGTLKTIDRVGEGAHIIYEKQLNDNEDFEIDPTITLADDSYTLTDSTNDNDCLDYNAKASTGIPNVKRFLAASATDCRRVGIQFDVSTIPDIATVQSIKLEFDITATENGGLVCNYYEVTTDLTGGGSQAMFDDLRDGDLYLSSSTECMTIANDQVITFNALAETNLELDLTTDELFGVSVVHTDEVQDATEYSSTHANIELIVEYDETTAWSPGPPINPAATQGTIANGINFTWTPSNATGIIGYAIYNATTNATEGSGLWSNFVNVGNTSFNLISGLGSCEVKMWLKTSGFGLSNGSNTTGVRGFSSCGPPNAADSSLAAIMDFTSAALSWDQPDFNGGTLSGYEVNRTGPALWGSSNCYNRYFNRCHELRGHGIKFVY